MPSWAHSHQDCVIRLHNFKTRWSANWHNKSTKPKRGGSTGMRHKIIRYTVLTMVAILMLATMTGCLFGGDDEPIVEEETPDVEATVSARLTEAAPTAVPPDPEGTVAAMLAAALAAQEAQGALDAQATIEAQPPPTNTPEPADTPVPVVLPTDTRFRRFSPLIRQSQPLPLIH